MIELAWGFFTVVVMLEIPMCLVELLEGLSRKFAAIVVDAADRARITIEPKREKFCGDVGRRFVF